MIVADTNLAAYLLVGGDRTEQARAVWNRDPEWRLPTFWRWEYINVLWLSVRSGHMDHGEALRAWREGLDFTGGCEVDLDGETVLETAIRYGITGYDAQFVTLAESLGVPLVTADRKLVRACRSVAVSYAGFLRSR